MAVGSHAAVKGDVAKPQKWPTDALVSRQRDLQWTNRPISRRLSRIKNLRTQRGSTVLPANWIVTQDWWRTRGCVVSRRSMRQPNPRTELAAAPIDTGFDDNPVSQSINGLVEE